MTGSSAGRDDGPVDAAEFDPADPRRWAAAVVGGGAPASLASSLGFPQDVLPEPQWRDFFDTVVRQRLSTMLKAQVDQGRFPVSGPQEQELSHQARADTLRVLWLEAALVETAARLAASGIDFRVLKGAALAHTVYDSPLLRPYGDVDLLIPAPQFDEALAVLVAAGSERVHQEPRHGFVTRFGKSVELVRPDRVSLDVHVSLAVGIHALRIGNADLFTSGTPFQLAGRTLQGLGPAERFLHACYHATVGNLADKLVPYLDVVRTLCAPEFDPARAAWLEQRWRAEAVVAEALCRSWDVLGIGQEPRRVEEARRYEPTPVERELLRAGVDEGALPWAEVGAMLRSIPSFRRRAVYLLDLVLPSKAYLAERGQSRRGRLVSVVQQTRRRSRV